MDKIDKADEELKYCYKYPPSECNDGLCHLWV